MRVPTHDAAPGAKSYGGMGERVLRAMGWSKCARPTTDARRDDDDRRPTRDRRRRANGEENGRLTARERPARDDRGDGLGKRRHGRAEAIEVVKREDNAGVGKGEDEVRVGRKVVGGDVRERGEQDCARRRRRGRREDDVVDVDVGTRRRLVRERGFERG